jgi:glycine oxidase
VGSTQEDVGFDKATTKEAIEKLTQGGIRAIPDLEKAKVEATWSGLRPKGVDDLPSLGKIPGFENLWIAGGHFTHGILLSAATGHLMAQAVLGEKPDLDLSPFAPDRKAQAGI